MSTLVELMRKESLIRDKGRSMATTLQELALKAIAKEVKQGQAPVAPLPIATIRRELGADGWHPREEPAATRHLFKTVALT